jgi:hypothetical protein
MLDRTAAFDLSNRSNAWIAATGDRLDGVTVPNAPRRVYLDDDFVVFCLVSPEDYVWVTQWRWSWKWDRTKQKRYALRSGWIDGRRVSIYMHKALLNHSGKPQPSEKHTIGDHRNGESLDNQIDNLEWETVSGNRRNRRR